MRNLSSYINKRIHTQFHKEPVILDLSHGLFSSNTVDSGSLLLLKSLPDNIHYGTTRAILDAGSGTGVLGIALGKKCPGSEVTFQDRDALGTEFSRHNAELNRLDNFRIRHSLLLEKAEPKEFDCILSNFPAKAGRPVLEQFLTEAPYYLTEGGVCAVVVVSPLAEFTRNILEATGMEITYENSIKSHSVYHFRGKVEDKKIPEPDIPHSYIRAQEKFHIKDIRYRLETVYGLPEFDTLSRHTKLAGELLRRKPPSGRILFWNPGQGHLPAAASLLGQKLLEPVLSGRDCLSLQISRKNLLKHECLPEVIPGTAALEDLQDHGLKYDGITALPDPVPNVKWEKPFMHGAARLLYPGGILVIGGRSVDISRLLTAASGFSLDYSVKDKGYRAVSMKLL
ncbi:MAG: methyltransferase [Spirochaetia bacterium]